MSEMKMDRSHAHDFSSNVDTSSQRERKISCIDRKRTRGTTEKRAEVTGRIMRSETHVAQTRQNTATLAKGKDQLSAG